MNYRAIIPFIPSMGSVSPIMVSDHHGESKEENVLWHLNSMRRHDNLRGWDEIPPEIAEKIKYVPIINP